MSMQHVKWQNLLKARDAIIEVRKNLNEAPLVQAVAEVVDENINKEIKSRLEAMPSKAEASRLCEQIFPVNLS